MLCGLNGRDAQYGKEKVPALRIGSHMWYVSLAVLALEAQGPAENDPLLANHAMLAPCSDASHNILLRHQEKRQWYFCMQTTCGTRSTWLRHRTTHTREPHSVRPAITARALPTCPCPCPGAALAPHRTCVWLAAPPGLACHVASPSETYL